MELTAENLTSGVFVNLPVQCEITWKSGDAEHTAIIYVRQLGYHAAVSDIKAHVNGGDALAGRIAACICDREGKAIFTADDITGNASPDRGPLDANLTLALLTAISEVNSLGESQS